MARTTVEKIRSVQEQIQQLENQRKKLMQEQKEQERKARTKRLIERGAILESFIPGADTFTNDQIKIFLEKLIQREAAPEKAPWMTRRSGAPVNGKDIDTTRETG